MIRSKIQFTFYTGLLLLATFGIAKAQQRKSPPKIHKPTAITYLYGGQIGDNDSVSVSEFKTLLNHNLVVKDSMGTEIPVQSFNFVYINRGVYADSTGRPIILSDYLYSRSENGVLPEFWKKGLLPQVKAGDTAIFTDIRYYPANTNTPKQDTAVTTNIIKTDTAKSSSDTLLKRPPAPLLYGKTIHIFLY